MQRISKFFFYLVSIILSLLAIAIGAAVLWVVTSPRSLPILTEHIEGELNNIKENYSFSISDTVLQWDGWEDNLSLHVKELMIHNTSTDAQIATFPDIKINLDIPNLFLGKVIFDESNILNPELRISLPQSEDVVTYGETKYNKFVEIYFSTVLKLLKELDGLKSNLPLRNIGIKNGIIVVDNGIQEVPWHIPEALISIDMSRESPSFEVAIELLDELSSRRSFLKIDARDAREYGHVNIETEITNITSSYAADLFPNFSWLKNLDINLSGKASITLDTLGVVDTIDFHVLSQAEDDATLGISGEMEVYPEYKNYINVPSGTARIFIKNMPVEELGRYWPPDFGADAREWVIRNIGHGIIHDGEAILTLSSDDFIEGTIDKEAIQGRIKYSGLLVNYMDSFYPVEQILGTAAFDGDSLTFDIQQGTMKKSEVKGVVHISNIGSDDVQMEIDVSSVGKISDMQRHLTLIQEESKSSEKLLDLSKVEGDAETFHFYKFPLRTNLAFNEVAFRAGAKLANVFLPSVINNMDISRGNFELSVDRDGLRAEGSAYLNTTMANIKWVEDFTGKKEYSTEYLVASYITPKEFYILGGPKLRNVSGSMASKLSIKQKGGKRDIVAKIDLKDADIKVPNLGWTKKNGDEASLELYVEDVRKQNYKVKSFNLFSKDLSANGIAEIEKGDKPKSMIDFHELKIGDTDLQARIISVGGNEYVITVKGKSFDANPVLDSLSEGVHTEDEPMSVDVDLLLEKMILKNGQIIHGVEGHVLCQESGCRTVGLKGKLGGIENVEITLKPDAGDRVFSITSENGGKILRGLNIHKHVVGGQFVTSASTPINDPEKPYEGKLIMKDFRIRKAPALTKVLTLASFSGIVDLLNGDGISFDKMKGNYSFKNNILKLRNVKASGGSLAITIEGDIDFNTGDVKLQGNVVPATFLNKILENIPFFGFALTGGGDESLIATRYTITGQFTDPEVTVNPFSILTPGFLRNIWGDVVESDDDDFESKQDSEEKDKEENGAPIELH